MNYSNYDKKKAEEIKKMFPEMSFTDYQLSILTDDDDEDEEGDDDAWRDFEEEE